MEERQTKLLDKIRNAAITIDDAHLALLNELLITPGHEQHQQVARLLQDIKSPSTIPFIRKALESNFDYLEYTCSDSDAIAKWFSWLLCSIGTDEAISVIREYTTSDNEGIRNEMIYRLNRILL